MVKFFLLVFRFFAGLLSSRVELSGGKPSNKRDGSIHKHKYVTKYRNSFASILAHPQQLHVDENVEIKLRYIFHHRLSHSLQLDDDYYKFTLLLRCLISLFHPTSTLSAVNVYIQCCVMYVEMQKPAIQHFLPACEI